MLWLNSCPRCNNGDLVEKKDLYGRFVTCLQCSYYLTTEQEHQVRNGPPTQMTTWRNIEVELTASL